MAHEMIPQLLAAMVVSLFLLSALTTVVIPMAFGLFDRRP
jgi:hypothetical protein